MNKSNLFIESLYEFKRTRRSTLFRIFTILAIIGLIIYQFTFLSRESYTASIKDWFQFYMDWTSQALPASIPFKSAYYFNIIQLLFVSCFTTNDSKGFGRSTKEALYARPQNNSDIVIGSFLGRLLAVTTLNWLSFATSIILNLIQYPRSFELSYYFFYWSTLTLPFSIYLLGISYLITRLVRIPGLSIIILLVFFGSMTLGGAIFLHGLFDPCARYIPNIFSDFTGHVNLENYLLQRGSILLTGISFLVLSIIPYPRIPNRPHVFKKYLASASILFILASGLALFYHTRHEAIENIRETYKQANAKHGGFAHVKVIRHDLHLKELEDGNISAKSHMKIVNKSSSKTPLVIYLNPGLKVTSIEIDREVVFFRREHQVLLPNKELEPLDTCEVSISYEGGIDNEMCFLDVAPQEYNSSGVNSLGIYHFGYTPAFCEKGYKLLTPECIWYPVCVPPYYLTGSKNVNFTRYSLKIEHDPRLTAISQGNVINEREGETSFRFDHNMSGISLCIGNYKKREITIDSIRVRLYYLPHHEHLLEKFDFPKKELETELSYIKRELEAQECIELGENNGFDPLQHYPYRWFTLLEVPCSFHCFPGLTRLTGEKEQGGIIFIPEKAHSIKNYRHKVFKKNAEEQDKMFHEMRNDIDMIIKAGSCDIRHIFRGKTIFIFSNEYPIIHDVFTDIAYKASRMTSSLVDDHPTIEYLMDHSLKDALHDNQLSPREIQNIIRKKSTELCMHIMLQVREDPFRQFYHDFLADNLFKETTQEEYFLQFYQSFGIRLDSLVKDWYIIDRLPLLDIRDARAIKIGEVREASMPDILCSFKVLNRSNISGLVMTGDHQGWIIPPHECREIRVRNRKDIYLISNYFALETPFAQNLPASVDLRLETPKNIDIDTVTGVFSLDSSTFFQNKNNEEIIVDNEDPGFKVVKAKGFNIMSRFRKETNYKKYYNRYSKQDAWLPVIDESFYGFPVRSAYHKYAGSGKQKVEWNAQLPREGKYEIFFYHVKPYDITQDPMQEFYYTVFDGREEHKVIASVSWDEVGWISLGVFNLSQKAKVTLNDRDRKNKIKTKYGCFPQELVADAVKWVQVKE